jgi:hypothetical protein
MNLSNLFLISEFTQILNLFGKTNLLSKYQFDSKENLRFVIDGKLNKNNDIVFTFNFYEKNKKVDLTDISTIHILNVLDKFTVYVEKLAPFKQDLQIPRIPEIPNMPKFQTLLNNSKTLLSLMKTIINQSDTNRKILHLYMNKSLNIYTVNGFNNVSISRTIVRSFDRINIISSEFINNKHIEILMNLHNLNIVLLNYFLQNNLSLIFHSLAVIIAIVRIFIMMAWIISIGIFAITGFSMDIVNILNSSLFYIFNLVFLASWIFAPRIAIAMIKLRMKAGLNR